MAQLSVHTQAIWQVCLCPLWQRFLLSALQTLPTAELRQATVLLTQYLSFDESAFAPSQEYVKKKKIKKIFD